MSINLLTDTDAEKAVLGSILSRGNLVYNCNLKPQDFYKTNHQNIFKLILDFKKDNIPIDIVTFIEKIKQLKYEEQVGGISYIFSLTSCAPSTLNFDYYQKIVKDKSYKRQLYLNTLNLIELLKSDSDIEQINDTMAKIVNWENQDVDIEDASDSFKKFWNDLEKKQGIEFIPTGLNKLDNLLGGFTKQTLNIIACRPSIGKSSLATQLALYQLLNNKKVLFFTLEMSTQQLMRRMISQYTRINHFNIQRLNLSDNDWKVLSELPEKFINFPLYIHDSSSLSVNDIENIATKVKYTKGLDFIFIDYLGLMELPKGEKKVDQLGEITRRLKLLAKKLDIVVILLSQLNRNPEARQDKKPSIADLRESGALEQDADLVFLIWRKPDISGLPSDNGELIIGKNRDGAIGSITLSFNNNILKFEEEQNGDF